MQSFNSCRLRSLPNEGALSVLLKISKYMKLTCGELPAPELAPGSLFASYTWNFQRDEAQLDAALKYHTSKSSGEGI